MKPFAITLILLSHLAAAQGVGTGMRPMEPLIGVYRANGNPSGVAQGHESDPFSYLTFFADGLVRRTPPEEGLQGWDDAFWMNLDRRSGDAGRIARWGTYLLAGGQREIVFADRQVWSIDIRGYPKSIDVQGRTYVLLDSGNALKLQGTYKSVKDDSFISFAPDGRMNQQGLFANCISGGQHFSYGGGMPSAHSGASLCLNKPLAGAYAVGNYTLQLHFPTSSPKFAFWADRGPADRGPAGTSPQTLYINGTRYELIH